jgi:hypothetical protein
VVLALLVWVLTHTTVELWVGRVQPPSPPNQHKTALGGPAVIPLLGAGHTVYMELATLRSALDGLQNPATMTTYERTSESQWWSGQADQVQARIGPAAIALNVDLHSAHSYAAGFDRAALAGVDQAALTRNYIRALYGQPASGPMWSDRVAMRAQVAQDIAALVSAMIPLCQAAPNSGVLQANCTDLAPDLPRIASA